MYPSEEELSLSEFLRKFELDGSNIFNNFIKKQPLVYSYVG